VEVTSGSQPRVILRAATIDDHGWLTENYALNDFRPSAPDDYVVIAERDGQPAGSGRLVRRSDSVELGGIFVSDAYRGQGISRLILGHLVNRGRDEALYCIPFAKLTGFYGSFNFKPVDPSAAPPSISEKFGWCQSHYADEVGLMRRDADRQ
jgi:N-acetylglutamate synthase-like GNAT family acetyltransferase